MFRKLVQMSFFLFGVDFCRVNFPPLIFVNREKKEPINKEHVKELVVGMPRKCPGDGLVYTEQMDAEGLGRKLLLTPSGDPRRAPEKQTVGTVLASHKMLTLQALSSSLNSGTAKRGCLGRGEAFGCPPEVCPAKRPRPFAHS